MKKLVLLLPLMVFAIYSYGQSISKATITAATDAAAEIYQLNEKQVPKMQQIQERRLKNLSEIEPLRSTNYELYLQKKNAVRLGTQASIKRLLNEAQMPILKEQMLERRKRESKLIQDMKMEGASREEMQLAIWELE